MITEAELEQRRFYLATHKRIPEEYRDLPSELDRMYDAITMEVRKEAPEKLRAIVPYRILTAVVCPICGWISKPFSFSFAVRGNFDPRPVYFGFIARILANHLLRKHSDLFERVERSRFGQTKYGRYYIRATYRCRICGQEENGIIEILAHYFAEHTAILEDQDRAEEASTLFGPGMPEAIEDDF